MGATLDVVFFELRGRRCALPVSAVREVLPLPSWTPVPLAPAAVRGVAPVHGQVLPVIDLGVWFAPGGDARDASLFRSGADKVLLVEADADGDTAPVRAVLTVDRLMRLGAIDEDHARPAPAGPPFVAATVLDIEGPALLIDATRALEKVRESIRATVTA